ncbi:uncharacterized protein LOC126750461 [Anthonomus grandis grandis]|uniref:uncharacterized protein LOC126750461 n=1 Tax=Anthonomus grandis grandis TaxID=2921223 RepID=UPI0021654816|nr:uncharacterized protein LOC126750461 [Anthonomus grandis grandis]
MFVKLVTLALCLTSTLAVYNGPLAGGLPASLYPAGVSPQACPNFPNCNNPAVAANPNSPTQQQWGSPQPQAWGQQQPAWTQQPQNQWNNAQAVPQWNGNNNDVLLKGGYTGDGDYRGEGLAEALAPGYENSDVWRNWATGGQQQANQWNQAPQGPTHGVGQIPAGVDAGACPNYPFCGH